MLRRFNARLALALFISAAPASATLALTTAGINDGFTLTTFLSGYNAQYGPLAQGVLPNGNIVTGSLLNNKVYVFSDVDGQNLTNALFASSYACTTGNCNFAMTTAGGQVYGAQAAGGARAFRVTARSPRFQTWLPRVLRQFRHVERSGQRSSSPHTRAGYRPWPAPSARSTIMLIDGVTVSADGGTIYAESGGTVVAYSLNTGALIHTYFTDTARRLWRQLSGSLTATLSSTTTTARWDC